MYIKINKVGPRNAQEHRQEKPRKSKVNTMHTNQTLTIKSEPETTNMTFI
jgi:hypothetical protein